MGDQGALRGQVDGDDSNGPLDEWGKLIGDVPAATAILDRFLHHAEIITITGRSYRLKDRAKQEPQRPDGQKPGLQAKTNGKKAKKTKKA